MNKWQIRRKRSDKSSAISMTNLEFMKIFYWLPMLFYFVTRAINILVYFYIYED